MFSSSAKNVQRQQLDPTNYLAVDFRWKFIIVGERRMHHVC